MNEEILNAIIESTMLGTEDHGILSFFLYLNYGVSSQGAGGYALDRPLKDKNGKFVRRVGTAEGMELIAEILRVVGVSKWEDLKGKHIRAKGNFSGVKAIGHIIQDKWLDFDEFWKISPDSK